MLQLIAEAAGGAGEGVQPEDRAGEALWEGHHQVAFGVLPRPLHFLPMWQHCWQVGAEQTRLLTPAPIVLEQARQVARLGVLGEGGGGGPGLRSTSPARRSRVGSGSLSWGGGEGERGGRGVTSPDGEAWALRGRGVVGIWLASGEFGEGGLAGGPPLGKKGAPQ